VVIGTAPGLRSWRSSGSPNGARPRWP